MELKKLVTASIALLLVGCVHYQKVESIQTNGETTEARVEIGSDLVKEGDELNVFKQVCTWKAQPKGSSTKNNCQKIKVGEAQVTKVLDKTHSLAKLQGEFQLDALTFVEKK